jgi:para-aminobenzoate synthetase component 1
MDAVVLAKPPAPHDVVPILARSRAPFVLQSATRDERFGRFSFAGAEPYLTVTARDGVVNTEDHRTGARASIEGEVFAILRDLLEEHGRPAEHPGTPLAAGAVGFFSYDLARSVERLPSLALDDVDVPDLCIGFYDRIVTWDHTRGTAFVTGKGAADLAGEIDGVGRSKLELPVLSSPLRSTFGRADYTAAVAKARELIAAGDIFQVNLSQRFTTDVAAPGHRMFPLLTHVNPAPFMAYLTGPDGLEVLSASPERFLRVEGREIESTPIKGTRPRSPDPAEDRANARELLRSEKDRAELVMIVDLLRNDIGRVAAFGSVRVPELPALTRHPTVHHLHGTITGRLAEGKDRFDLLRAAFPCGSITGAPKVRAMEIIEEMEPVRRGVYTGAIGWLSFDGGMDLNVAIRTMTCRDGKARFSVGGGIVADSDPRAEFEETLSKGRGLARTLGFQL